jgi:hypothetical protein
MKQLESEQPQRLQSEVFHCGMSRRSFIGGSLVGLLGLGMHRFATGASVSKGSKDLQANGLVLDLMLDWCDGMLDLQIHDPADPTRHGALRCPSCSFIHGRCMDAVYPFLAAATYSGSEKYLDAGIRVFEWSQNVSQEDGSWTVIPNPNSWRGITVFGAISLGEALHYHGHLLDSSRRKRWTERLRAAAEYVHQTFTIDFTNINYGCAGIYALHLLGHIFEDERYLLHSRSLASQVGRYFTQPNLLLFGEGKPSDLLSGKGLYAVDIGYNVEESMVLLALYAADSGDAEFSELIQRSLSSHLEFMLPDGGWDNSFGTRQFKWTYWGSRTCDGCQPGYAVFSKNDPAFFRAAIENTKLLKRCTHDGLLYGGRTTTRMG